MSRSKNESASESTPRYAANVGPREKAKVAPRAKAESGKGRVPRIRFPEFIGTCGWEAKSLSDISVFLSSLSGKNSDDFIDGNADYIPYINVFENTFVDLDNLRKVNINSNENQNLVRRGDVFFTVSSETADEAGMSSVLLYDIPNCYLNSFCIICRLGIKHDSSFLGYFLRSSGPRKFFSEHAQGFIRANISRNTFAELLLLLPLLTKEQKKIAACLSSLDELLSAHTRKLEALKKYKRGLMQQFFPIEGETVPRLRFASFDIDCSWITQKTSQLLEKVINPVKVEPEKLYQQIGIRSHGKGIFHKDSVSGEELGSKRVFWIEENAFIVNIVFAWEQALAVTSIEENGMIASHRFPMYKAKDGKCTVEFVKHFFLTRRGEVLLGIASPGGAGRNKTLGQKEFDDISFLVPKEVREQRKIASALSSLDDLIAAQAAKIEELKEHKRGLMQGLFPAPEEDA